MIEGILFDAEGVVVDSEAIWDKGQDLFLSKRSIVYDREKVKPLLTGQSMIDGVKVMQQLYGDKLSGNIEELAQERIDIIRELFRTQIAFIPGFERFYKSLNDKYKTCIATAMNKGLLRDVDAKLGLTRLFNNQVFSIADVGGKSKPDPAIFLYAAKQLGLTPERCVVIEDAPHGIKAAKNAGMYCIGISTTYAKDKLQEADQIVDSFSQIQIPYQ
jgi:HAD superfamily hydrolase (TIGR01509 family)